MSDAASPEAEKLKVLVVDDELIIADSLVTILRLNGFYAVARYNGMEAIESVKSEPFDVILSDVVMPEMNGIISSRQIREICPECHVIFISGNQATAQLLEDERKAGVTIEIFAKPVHPTEIIERLRTIEVDKRAKKDRSARSGCAVN